MLRITGYMYARGGAKSSEERGPVDGIETERNRELVSVAMGRSPGGAYIFAPRQPCVISARRHVAFQCIISAGKMPPDMQNQISVRVALSLRLSHFRRLFLSSVLFTLSRCGHCPVAVSFCRLLFLFFLLFTLPCFCFWYPLPSIDSRGLSCRLVAVALTVSFLLPFESHAVTSRYGKRVYETLLLFCSLKTTQ